MATISDFISSITALLPRRWFGDDPAIAPAMVAGGADAALMVQGQIDWAKAQTRLSTANDGSLDLIAADYFGLGQFPRRAGEGGTSYSSRIRAERLRPRGTRAAMISALVSMTGLEQQSVSEPANLVDHGAWDHMFFDAGTTYMSYEMQYQVYLDVTVPSGPGITMMGSFFDASAYFDASMYWASDADLESVIEDAEVYRCIDATIPAGVDYCVKITLAPAVDASSAPVADFEDTENSEMLLLF